MARTTADSAPISDTAENRISHFIPPVELEGTLADKLQKLDTLIDYLLQLRRSLAGDATDAGGGYEGPGRRMDAAVWPWFVAGVVVGLLFLLLLLFAWTVA